MINILQFIFSEPIVEIQVATKIHFVSGLTGTPMPHIFIATDRQLLESAQFQVSFFFLYAVLKEYRACCAESRFMD